MGQEVGGQKAGRWRDWKLGEQEVWRQWDHQSRDKETGNWETKRL